MEVLIQQLRITHFLRHESVNTTVSNNPREKMLLLFFGLLIRSSHRRCFIKKDVLKNFTKFKGKHLCQSVFLNEVPGLSLQEHLFLQNTVGRLILTDL